MTANTAPADDAVVRKITLLDDRIRAADKPLGQLAETIAEDQILRGYLAALTEVPGTQIAAYSRQSIRADWPAGPLTASRVYNSLPWSTTLVQLTLTPPQLERLRGIRGMRLLTRDDLPPREPLVVTTSRFFGSILAQELGLPADALRPAGTASEFDFFLAYLARAPQPLALTLPAGWTLDETSAR